MLAMTLTSTLYSIQLRRLLRCYAAARPLLVALGASSVAAPLSFPVTPVDGQGQQQGLNNRSLGHQEWRGRGCQWSQRSRNNDDNDNNKNTGGAGAARVVS